MAFPESLPGHWDTPDGRAMAESNARVSSRSFLTKGAVSDFALANAVFLASREDLDLIVWQTAAKERIRWLSAHLAVAVEATSTMGVTDNARLLMGYVAGALMRDTQYVVDSVDVEAGTQVILNTVTGNTFRIAVVQLAGVE